MARIGFAYNQKPETDAGPLHEDDLARPDEEPPSRPRGPSSSLSSRSSKSTRASEANTATAVAPPSIPAPSPDDDEFAEWDTADTIDAVARALAAYGDVIRLEANESFPEQLRSARPDIVFNIAEGLHGPNREAHVPAICEFFGIPYSGSDPFALSLCLDKARTKEILSHHGVPTAPFVVVREMHELRGIRESGVGPRNGATLTPNPQPLTPVFVKPLHEGSSKGITEQNLCRSASELEARVEFLLDHYEQPVLIEEYLPGAEFTCAILGNDASARLLPIVGMNFTALPAGALPIYGFEAKWVWDRPEQPLDIFECPARIDDGLRRAIEQVVLRAYRVLGCRDWSRIDVRLDAAGIPHVVEVNPLPGILPDPSDNSCFPKAARAAGMSYDQLIQRCLLHAAERQKVTLAAEMRRAGGHTRPNARVAAQR